MTHDEVRDLLAAYALDAVEPEEARAVAAHLATCLPCRRDVAALREVAAGLATGVPAVAPPDALKSRVMAAIRPDVTVAPRRGPEAPVPHGPPTWMRPAVALAAAVAIVLAGINVVINQRVADLSRQVAVLNEERAALNERVAAQERVLALLASPATKTAALTGTVPAGVRFVYDPARRQGALVVSDLRDPGTEFVYQLWLVAGQTPESAGVFRPAPGRTIIVPVEADFLRYQAVAISVERGPGGAPQPTAAPILLANL